MIYAIQEAKRTKTPFDEFLEDAGFEIAYVAVAFDRTESIKAIWSREVLTAPPGALDGADGAVLSHPDPEDRSKEIVYEKKTYGTNTVVECEGVVVCRLIG